MLREQALRLIERRANWCRHQLFFRHDVTNRPVELTLELQIAIGDDADQLARAIHNRHARDLEAYHQLLRLAERPVRSERDRVHDHAGFAALDPIHFGRLTVHRHVLVNHADAP